MTVLPETQAPWPARDGLAKLQANAFKRNSAWSDDPTDLSRSEYYEGALDPSLIGAWRTPSSSSHGSTVARKPIVPQLIANTVTRVPV